MRGIVLAVLLAAMPLAAYALYPEWSNRGTIRVAGIRTIATGDFNGDGRTDLLLRSFDNALSLSITDSQGKPGAPTVLYTGQFLGDAVVGDLDGDGKPDVVVSDTAVNMLIFLRSRGDGTFDPPVTTSLTFAPSQLAAADFDGDGRLDLAVRSTSGSILAIYHSDGTGHFTEVSRTPLSSASSSDMRVGDIDGDGHMDVLVARTDPAGFDLFFGRGDDTFDAAVAFNTPTASTRYVIADLNGDGRDEILSAEVKANTISVRVNLGSRTFAPPVVYQATQTHETFANPYDLIVADVNGDGKPDVVVTLVNERNLGIFPGNGDGTLGQPNFQFLQTASLDFFPYQIVRGDFTGRGKNDIAITSIGQTLAVATYADVAGEVSLSLTAPYPIISTGQPITFTYLIDYAAGVSPSPPFPPRFTGTVTLLDGTTPLASAAFASPWAFTVPSFSAGTHTLTVQYSGDSNWHGAVSPGTTLNVTTDKTTTTLTSSTAGQAVTYGTQFVLTTTVQSTIPGNVTGSLTGYVDSVRQEFSSPYQWDVNYLPVGTHTFYVTYEGNQTQPPSTSNAVTQVITKAPSTTQIDSSIAPLPVGKAFNLAIGLTGPDSRAPGGLVSIYEGAQRLIVVVADTRGASGGTEVEIRMPPFLVSGPHVIHATYAGDANHEPSASADQTITILPGSLEPARRRLVRH